MEIRIISATQSERRVFLMKIKKRIFGLVLFISVMLVGASVSAAKPLNADFATFQVCRLTDASTIALAGTFPEVPASDDGLLYVFSLMPYEYDIPVGAQAVATIPLTTEPMASFSLTDPTYGTRLYCKFVFAVANGGQFRMISQPQYIINPELLATQTRPRAVRPLKSLQGRDFLNYYVDGDVNKNMTTIQFLSNGINPATTHPMAYAADSRPVDKLHYMMNATNAQGVFALVTEFQKIAKNGVTENFVIGNEVNIRKWNYVAWTDWDTYVRDYYQVFRVAYNAIKSINANARVFICLDQTWDRNRPASHGEYYEALDGKDFLDKFNAIVKREGNIDWGLNQHPYNVPLTWSKFWDYNGCPDGGYCKAQVNSNKMVTVQNLSVITNYIQKPEFLYEGNVRHFIIGEIGASRDQGVEAQAACLCAQYVVARNNPVVEEIIYLLQDDNTVNSSTSGFSAEMWENMDGANGAAYEAQAMSIIGISDWSQVIKW